MVITQILKTLSHSEIMCIAEQLDNPDISDQTVYDQLIAKGNEGETLKDMVFEMTSDNMRGTLPRLVALELSERLQEVLKQNLNKL